MNIITNDTRQCAVAAEALKEIIDPEMTLDVVALGLIYQLDFDVADVIYVRMTLTTPFCPMGQLLSSGVQRVLERTFPGYAVQLRLTFSPVWTAERIAESAKHLLNH